MISRISNYVVEFIDNDSANTILELDTTAVPSYTIGQDIYLNEIRYIVRDIIHHIYSIKREYKLAVWIEKQEEE